MIATLACRYCFTSSPQFHSPSDTFPFNSCDSSVSSDGDDDKEPRRTPSCSCSYRLLSIRMVEEQQGVKKATENTSGVVAQETAAFSSLSFGGDDRSTIENAEAAISPNTICRGELVTAVLPDKASWRSCSITKQEALSATTSTNTTSCIGTRKVAAMVVQDDESTCSRSRCKPRKSVRFVQDCAETRRIRHEVRHFTTTGADSTTTDRDTLMNKKKSSMETSTIDTTKTANDNDIMWWTEAELKQIRRFCSHVVSEYRLHDGEDLILAYLRLQKRTLSSEEFRRCRKTLAASYDDTRGLEHFVAKAATELQHRRYIQTVLDAQKRHRQQEELLVIQQQSLHGGGGSSCSRSRSSSEGRLLEIAALAQKASFSSRQVAQRLAICDYHAAMHVHLEKQCIQ